MPFETQPDFFDPEDDGIHEYFDADGRRILKAEWLVAETEQQKTFDAAAAKDLPLSSMAKYRLAEAGYDFQYHLEVIATKFAREAGRTEVAWEDSCRAAELAFRTLLGK